METIRFRGTIGKLGASGAFGYITPESIMDARTGQPMPTRDDVFVHEDGMPVKLSVGLQLEFELIADTTRGEGTSRAYKISLPGQEPVQFILSANDIIRVINQATPDERHAIMRTLGVNTYVSNAKTMGYRIGVVIGWSFWILFLIKMAT